MHGYSSAEAITQRIMEGHEAAVLLLRDGYESAVAPWRELLVGLEKANRCPLMDVVYSLIKDCESVPCGQGGGATMMILAAAHDEIMARTEPKAYGQDARATGGGA